MNSFTKNIAIHWGKAALGFVVWMVAGALCFRILGDYFIKGGEHPLSGAMRFFQLPPLVKAIPDSWMEVNLFNQFWSWMLLLTYSLMPPTFAVYLCELLSGRTKTDQSA